MADEDDCLLCAKQRGVGPLACPVIFNDDLVLVTHRATGSLGYVFIETTRHVPYVHQLTDAEATAVGRVRTRVAAALAAELPVEHVFTMVVGNAACRTSTNTSSSATSARRPTCPGANPGPDAPTGDIDSLVDRLRTRLVG